MAEFIESRFELQQRLQGAIASKAISEEAFVMALCDPRFDEDYKLQKWHSLSREKLLTVLRLLNEASSAWDDFLAGAGVERGSET